jgi:hypothetical protein
VFIDLLVSIALLSIALLAVSIALLAVSIALLAVFIAELAVFPAVFIAELAILPAVDDVLAVFDIVLLVFVTTAVLLAALLALVVLVLVAVSQAIPIAPKTKTVDNNKVFFILIKFSCLLQRLFLYLLDCKTQSCPKRFIFGTFDNINF